MKKKNIVDKIHFSFICPRGREIEATRLFTEKKLGILNPKFHEYILRWLDPITGKVVVVDGYKFSGLTTIENIKSIISSLSEREIAGFSKETQILFKPKFITND